MRAVKLTKSSYLAGLQCPRRLWLQSHAPSRATPPDASTLRRFAEGQGVGVAARALFPGGREGSAKLLADSRVPAVFEASFVTGALEVRVDVVERLPGGGFGLREVKSSASVKQEHFDDAVIQLFAMRGAGLDVSSVEVIHVDGAYARDEGPIDWSAFFVRHDVTPDVEFLLSDVDAQVGEFAQVLALAEEPRIEPSPHCRRPHPCPFFASCTRDKPDDWIYRLPRMRAPQFHALIERGIERISELTEDAVDHEGQVLAVRAQHGTGVAVANELGKRLAPSGPPALYLDFEAVGGALPTFPGAHPFESVPVQWSLHGLDEHAAVTHEAFLPEADADDPVRDFAQTLLVAVERDPRPILVYSGFEDLALGRVADRFPELAARIGAVRRRLFDLLPLVRRNVYATGFAGSYSIKRVAAALVPGFGYDDLGTVADGAAALGALERYFESGTPVAERAALREALLEYCARDTEALLLTHRALHRLC